VALSLFSPKFSYASQKYFAHDLSKIMRKAKAALYYVMLHIIITMSSLTLNLSLPEKGRS